MHLTERQRQLLNLTFIDYHATSEFLENPLVIDRAEGLYYWDTDGKRYFDAIGGIFVASLGHKHPRLMQAMRDQMERVTFAPPLISTTNVAGFGSGRISAEIHSPVLQANRKVEQI